MLVGGWGWNSADVAAYLDGEAKARGVLHLGYVPDRHMPALYNGARALIFPSFYEGFGLPPLEMLACGGAVIASTAGAIAETVGRVAHLVEPLDLDGWRTAMQRVVADDDWQQELRRGAETCSAVHLGSSAPPIRYRLIELCAATRTNLFVKPDDNALSLISS